MKKLSTLFGLMAALLFAPLAAQAQDITTLLSVINSYTGGASATGSLTANETVAGTEIAVTGNITGATSTLTLDIPAGVTVVWNASLAGSRNASSFIFIEGIGVFRVAGGLIENAGANGVAINPTDAGSTVKVSVGTVSAPAGTAILTYGDVEVSGGIVSTATGTAIRAAGPNSKVAVNGASAAVQATGNQGVAIQAEGANSTVEVSGTTTAVQATGNQGVAIQADGEGSTVKVSGGAVSAPVGVAIKADGANSTVEVSGGTVSTTTGDAITAIGNVKVSGTGNVIATAAAGVAIIGGGVNSTVEVSGGTVSATTGAAIDAKGNVKVSGGTVSATTGTAIISLDGNSLVEVSGGTVSATADGGDAIDAKGNVKVSGGTVSATTGAAIIARDGNSLVEVSGGTVSATTGDAIHTAGSVKVSGTGDVKATDNGSTGATTDGGTAIMAVGDFEVSGGTVSATTGYAINAAGTNSTVEVSGGTVQAADNGYQYQNTGGRAIHAQSAGSTVTVSGGTVSATSGHAIHANGNVNINGTGTVQASGNTYFTGVAIWAFTQGKTVEVSGGTVSATNNAIYANCDVKVSGGTVSATAGRAIYAAGGNTVKVSGGTVSTTTLRAIEAGDVEVSGGTVSATSGTAIYANYPNNTVKVSGGTVSATTGTAIYAGEATSAIEVSGGFVFAYGSKISAAASTDTDAVIYHAGAYTLSPGGVVVAWNTATGIATYNEGDITDLTVNPATATAIWHNNGTESGIGYANGATGGFFPITGVTVTPLPPAITTTALPDGTVGVPYSQNLAATGSTPITWTITGALPGGLTLDAATGVISGTPTAAGPFTFDVTATNGAGSDTQTLSITVSGTTPPSATRPTITGPASMTLKTGYLATSTGTYTITGTSPVTVSKVSGDPKITYESGVLNIAAGLPVGTYPVVLRASNSAGSHSLTFTLTVEEPVYWMEIPTFTGGKVTTSPPYISEAGKTVTLTITPDEGYELESITVTDLNNAAVIIPLNGSGNTRTFIMPSHHVAIVAVFKPTGANNVEEIHTGLKAYTQNSTLYISGLTAGNTYSVYNILGTLVYQSVANADKAEIALPGRGIYVIVSNGSVIKIAN
jgi:hypothetical protein